MFAAYYGRADTVRALKADGRIDVSLMNYVSFVFHGVAKGC